MWSRRRIRPGVALVWMGALTLGLRGASFISSSFEINDEAGLGPKKGLAESPVSGFGILNNHAASRHLLSLVNCTPRAVEQFPRDLFTQEQRVSGALLLHVLLVVYMFLALALVCDNYFVPSLEVLCDLLHLQTDVAGATFMAAGSSAPELATAVIGVFIAKDDVGLSTVVGSAIYNVMFVISVCGFAAGTAVQLNWWPLVRDCMAYLVSIGALIFVIFDEIITWYESVIFLALYVLYIIFMCFNQPLEKHVVPKITCCPHEATDQPDQVVVHYEKLSNGDAHSGRNGEEKVILDKNGRSPSFDSIDSSEETATEIHKAAPDPSLWHVPPGRWACLLWAVSLPINVLLHLTVPDCRRDNLRRWFWVTFIMSLVWLSLYSFLMVWMITIIGYTVNVPDSVMSLTFVAFGVSLPDVVASVLVIKDGLGDMAVSNAVGSNVFDILVCLGVPWFLKTCLIHPGSNITVYSKGLTYSSITLLSTVALLLTAFHVNKWKLDKRIAVLLLVVYVLYTILASLYELNVFGYFHPEECPSDY